MSAQKQTTWYFSEKIDVEIIMLYIWKYQCTKDKQFHLKFLQGNKESIWYLRPTLNKFFRVNLKILRLIFEIAETKQENVKELWAQINEMKTSLSN